NKVGAAQDYYDPEEAVAELHALDVRVIGRVVCFLDPTLASWAAENERPDLLVLDGSGSSPLANDYGTAAFTNLASAEVRDYQMDLATEAVSFGFDEILYDYVRRPEGDLTSMQFDGLKTAADVAVARFVAESSDRLDGTEALLGVSVFGIASTRPEQIAQDIQLLAPHVDYVSPMVYPSHWGDGEFGVADPVRQPGDIVRASVEDFHRVVAGSGAAVVPWLQDFDSGDVVYDVQKVSAQIDAARSTGSPGFLLWNPRSQYTVDALKPLAD
ncbi:MAG: putative glycoside hydrolase, partial [Ilumatobacteraceae bacterium]